MAVLRSAAAEPEGAAIPYGAIAQLGERLNGIQEVGGSIPPGSTIRLRRSYGVIQYLLHSLFRIRHFSATAKSVRTKTGTINFAMG